MLCACPALAPCIEPMLPAVCRWEAVLLVLDSRPFEDLHHIVQDFDDDRIWVFAEWVRSLPDRAAPGRHAVCRRPRNSFCLVRHAETCWHTNTV